MNITKETLQKFVTRGPTEKQLAAAKRSIIGKFPLQLASNSKILAYLSIIGFYHLPLDYLDTYQAKIAAVTLAQTKSAFKRYIRPDKMIIVTVGQPTHKSRRQADGTAGI